MTMNHKINVSQVTYSPMSQALRFHIEANAGAMLMIEDIYGRNDMSVEEMAKHMGELLERCLMTEYHRGGLRRKYD